LVHAVICSNDFNAVHAPSYDTIQEAQLAPRNRASAEHVIKKDWCNFTRKRWCVGLLVTSCIAIHYAVIL